jgi:hypothetical protein
MLDHLIKKKLIYIYLHLLYNCLVSAKPHIGLLCSWRIEAPFPVRCAKFWPKIWVAIPATLNVTLLMFALEVEDVHQEGTLIKVSLKMIRIVVKHGTDSAIIIMPDNGR